MTPNQETKETPNPLYTKTWELSILLKFLYFSHSEQVSG